MVTRRSVRRGVSITSPSGAGHRGTTLARRRSDESVSGRSDSARCRIPALSVRPYRRWISPPSHPAFVEMAHRIVWCSAATVDARGRPRSAHPPPAVAVGGRRPDRLDRHRTDAPEAGPPRRASVRVAHVLGTRTTTPARPSAVPSSSTTTTTRTEVWDTFVAAPAPVGLRPVDHPGVDQSDRRHLRRVEAHALAAARHARHGHDRRQGRPPHLAVARLTTARAISRSSRAATTSTSTTGERLGGRGRGLRARARRLRR